MQQPLLRIREENPLYKMIKLKGEDKYGKSKSMAEQTETECN